ncbi:hypothetical protein DSO57_1033786 [Entomophthora muscae]|uniref:Uncharacterized protein n=1 Tax=Entomophthora muscae TaxID=34485 RepID=A0ACC2UJW4_9FUNG|nr:hypothetical protein DSO57_1033786 [Entomophthora muscae]
MGVVRLLELADKCKNLQGIVHVSTAYVNCNLKSIVIEEKVYPIAIGDPHYLVENIPKISQPELDSLEESVLKGILTHTPSPWLSLGIPCLQEQPMEHCHRPPKYHLLPAIQAPPQMDPRIAAMLESVP